MKLRAGILAVAALSVARNASQHYNSGHLAMKLDDARTARKTLLQQMRADGDISTQAEEAAYKILEPYVDSVWENIDRVNELLVLAQDAHPPATDVWVTKGREGAAGDVLRAAVVLIHAYLEDFLRTIAGVLLPAGGESTLDAIPLAGISGRPEKFLLGKLVHHKGKLVDDVLRESVFRHLERTTYNNTDEIARLLETLGLEVPKYNKYFPTIQEMMLRRHQIVHRGDRLKAPGPDSSTLQPIEAAEVRTWLVATSQFLTMLSAAIAATVATKNLNIPALPR
ncbi:MAG TPA: HEPN domain-containing protein [Terriglobales bacterium]|nr:HEPN domain-containing protein [Terriglobales bacterium]